MPTLMTGFLTFAIFYIIGFTAGFVSAFAYWALQGRQSKSYQFADADNRQMPPRRQSPLDREIRTGVDGDTALSDFRKK